jgi:hypothetical protein
MRIHDGFEQSEYLAVNTTVPQRLRFEAKRYLFFLKRQLFFFWRFPPDKEVWT